MMHTLRVVALVVAANAFVPVAHAEDKERAREVYRGASQHYDFGEYQQALDGFKEAYRNYEDPAFLFNIAQCHRALGHKQDAVLFYRSYLRKSSDAPNRDEVQRTIVELEAALARERAEAASAKPAATTGTTSSPTTTSPATTSPATTMTRESPASAQAPAATVTRSETHDQPARKRTWIWGVVAGVVVVGVGVGLGVGLGMQAHPPQATYGTVRF